MGNKLFTEGFEIEAVRRATERRFAVKEMATRLMVSTCSL